MIQGIFGSGGQLFFELDLITNDGLNLQTKFFIYSGKILLDEQEYQIPVYAGEEITEVLLGSEWLKILPLVANY